MTSTLRAEVAAATRIVGIVALLCAAGAPSLVASAAVVHADPATTVPNARHALGMYGDPFAAAPYWHLPVLLAHYGIKADNIQTSINALEQDLAEKRRVIVILNAETLWNRPGKRNAANHFVVVAGMEPRAGVVHLNDSGVTNGRDEQVPIATFEQAWAPNRNSAIVTK
jgi:hypothetical protein